MAALTPPTYKAQQQQQQRQQQQQQHTSWIRREAWWIRREAMVVRMCYPLVVRRLYPSQTVVNLFLGGGRVRGKPAPPLTPRRKELLGKVGVMLGKGVRCLAVE